MSGAGDVTADLATFRAAYAQDDNLWWTLDCGHHQNLFEAACDALDALRQRADALAELLERFRWVHHATAESRDRCPLCQRSQAAIIAYHAASAPAGVRMAEYGGGDPT